MKTFAPLGDVAEFINGFAFKPNDWGDEGRKIIRIQNLTSPNKPYNLTTRQVDSRYDVNKGDLLVSWSATLGVFEWSEPDTALLNQHIFKVVPKDQLVDRDYLRHALVKAIDDMNRYLRGSTMKHVNRGEFLGTKIPLPPLPEQRRIAAILDKADAIRRKRQQAIRLTEEFLRSVFLDMFGDPVLNPKGWEVNDIQGLCSEIVDCVNRTAPIVDCPTPYKMIRTTNVRNYEIDITNVRFVDVSAYEKWTRRLVPKRGDIVFTREAPAGEAGIIESEDKVFLGQRTMHFRPDTSKTTSEYLLYELMGGGVKRQIGKLGAGSTVKHLSVPECKKFQVRMPPLELQKRFSEIVQHSKAMTRKQENAFEATECLFGATTQRAFRGDL